MRLELDYILDPYTCSKLRNRFMICYLVHKSNENRVNNVMVQRSLRKLKENIASLFWLQNMMHQNVFPFSSDRGMSLGLSSESPVYIFYVVTLCH